MKTVKTGYVIQHEDGRLHKGHTYRGRYTWTRDISKAARYGLRRRAVYDAKTMAGKSTASEKLTVRKVQMTYEVLD